MKTKTLTRITQIFANCEEFQVFGLNSRQFA
jgi:hypothetical protein